MTTRGQKRSNDATTSNVSESGNIINMLTSNRAEKSQHDETLTGPVKTKDVRGFREEGPAVAKDQATPDLTIADPATAKDPG